MDTLRAALERAADGRGSTLLVSGEPGIGKTRLVEHAFGELASERVLWGRCHEMPGAPVCWPWRQALRAWARVAPPALLEAARRADGAVLAGLVPELGGGDSADAPGLAPEGARFRLFDAVARLLRRIASDAPLTVVLEDLHWADGESLLLLATVARELSDAPVVLVGTYRDPDAMRTGAAARVLGELMHSVESVRLTGLTPDEVARLVDTAGGRTASPTLVADLHRATGGNPFYLGEVVEWLRASGRLQSSDGPSTRTLGLPDGVRDAVRRRLAPLPEPTQRLLVLAAILDHDADAFVLGRLAETSMTDVVATLEPALDLGVLRDAGNGSYRFAHALVQETLLDELGGDERARLHRQAADVLAALHADDPAPHLGTLAHHYLLGGDGEALRLGVDTARRAAAAAMDALGFEEAATYLERALEAARGLGAPPAERVPLLLELGEAQRRAGDEEGAIATCAEAARLARDLDDPLVVARVALGMSAARAETGRVDRRITVMLEEALVGLPADERELRILLLGALAGALYFSPDAADVGRRDAFTRDALALARAEGQPLGLVAALLGRHLSLWRAGTAVERQVLLDEIIALAERHQLPEFQCEAYSWRIVARLEQGLVVEADADLVEYARLADRIRSARHRWHVMVVRAARALMEGAVDDAEAMAFRALELRRSSFTNNSEQFFVLQLFNIRREQGRLGELEAAVEEGAARFGVLPIWRCGRALLEAELGRREPARRIVAAFAASAFDELPLDGNRLPGLATLADVVVLTDDVEHAEALYALLRPHAGTVIVTAIAAVVPGLVDRHLGALALVAGRRDDAVVHLESALVLADRIGAGPEAERIRALLARARGDAPSSPSGTMPTAAVSLAAALRHEGDFWTLAAGGEMTRLRDTKGVHYLAVLLAQPDRESHVMELLGVDDVPVGDSGEALDDEARRLYRRRLKELEQAIESGTATAAQRDEHEALGRELRRATGLGGRSRRVGSEAERARLNVTRAVRSVLQKVRQDCPQLGAHLDRAVRTGVFCSYASDPEQPIIWEVVRRVH